MTEHIVKTHPVYFDAVKRGDKRFEIRRDDRGYQKGDSLGNPALPKQTSTEHHALADARWTQEAWEFLAQRRSL